MAKRIEYDFGQELGPYKIKYIKEIEPFDNGKRKRRRAEFVCNYCGKHFNANIDNIKSGQTRSCGCYQQKVRSENGKKNAKDLTGQRFGNLIALEALDERNRNQIVWKCQCDCGNIHYAPSAELIRGNIKSCGCVYSFGEQQIQKLLEEMGIVFNKQKWFNDCINPKTNAKLFFDFYLPDYNCCIEYDGRQHFKEYSGSWEKLKDIQYRDNIKNNYCKNNNIKLIRISYKDKNKISIDYLWERINNVSICDLR